MGWFFDPLRPLHYELIVIDAPWPLVMRSAKGYRKSAENHYSTMDVEAIKTMPVGRLASMDCLLLCWATAPRLPLALAAIETWGFAYKSLLMWRKMTKNGKVRLGTGYRVRSTGELVIVATLGNPRQSYVPHTIFDGLARQHSRKPDEFYAMCDRLMPSARRCDLFAREARPGWDAFGNETTRFGALS